MFLFSIFCLVLQITGYIAESHKYWGYIYIFCAILITVFFSINFSKWHRITRDTEEAETRYFKATVFILTGSVLASLFRPTFFEDDYYRYFVDGVHFLKKIPVYQTAPLSSPLSGTYPDVFSNVGFPDVATVYPPVSIIYFAALAFISGMKFVIFKSLLRLVALIILSLVSWSLFSDFSRKKKFFLTLLFLNHPSLNTELIVNIHFDVLLVAFCMFFIVKRSMPILFFLWAGAIKLIAAIPAIFALPSLRQFKSQGFPLFVTTASFLFTIFYFLPDLRYYFLNLSYASLQWEMNSGLFRWIRKNLNYYISDYDSLIRTSQIAALFIFLLFALGVNHLSRKNKLRSTETYFYYIFSLPLFTPVCNPWYFTWAFPLLCSTKGSTKRKAILLSAYAPLFFYYFFYTLNAGFTEEPGIWLDMEHIFIFALLFISLAVKPSASDLLA